MADLNLKMTYQLSTRGPLVTLKPLATNEQALSSRIGFDYVNLLQMTKAELLRAEITYKYSNRKWLSNLYKRALVVRW